jgi:hypothetical protein
MPALSHKKPRCLLVANFVPRSSIWDMGRDIRTALEGAGVSVMEFLRSDFPNPKLLETMLRYIAAHDGPRFVLDINANENYRAGDRSLYDAFKLPRVSFITDSPLRHMEKIRAMPALSALGLVDGDFGAILEDFPVPCRAHFPMPHGGPAPIADPLPPAARDIPILMIGNIAPRPDPAAVAAAHPDMGGPAADALIERARTGTEGLYALVRQTLPEAGPETWLKAANALETHLIAARRIALLNALATWHPGLAVHHVGEIEPAVRADLPSGLVCHGPQSFEDALDLAARARVVLNASPSFRNGAHERLFYAVSRGARAATEPSRFLPPEEAAAIGAIRLPFAAAEAADVLADAAADTGWDQTGCMARCYQRHGWPRRIETLLDCLERDFWRG